MMAHGQHHGSSSKKLRTNKSLMMCTGRVLLTVLLLFNGVCPLWAEFPFPPPPPGVDPNSYHLYMFLPPGARLPNDFSGGGNYWKFTSDRTADLLRYSQQELFGVMGASVDKAWQISTGRPDVVVAVLD